MAIFIKTANNKKIRWLHDTVRKKLILLLLMSKKSPFIEAKQSVFIEKKTSTADFFLKVPNDSNEKYEISQLFKKCEKNTWISLSLVVFASEVL